MSVTEKKTYGQVAMGTLEALKDDPAIVKAGGPALQVLHTISGLVGEMIGRLPDDGLRGQIYGTIAYLRRLQYHPAYIDQIVSDWAWGYIDTSLRRAQRAAQTAESGE